MEGIGNQGVKWGNSWRREDKQERQKIAGNSIMIPGSGDWVLCAPKHGLAWKTNAGKNSSLVLTSPALSAGAGIAVTVVPNFG